MSPIVGVLSLKLVFVPIENSSLSLEQIHDLLIKQKALAEVLNLLAHEFIQLVHDIAQNTNAVLSNVVDHLLDTNRFQLLSVGCLLVENLSVQIVMIVFDKPVSLSKQQHDIHALLNLLGREVGPEDRNVQFIFAKHTDVLICSVVMGPISIHFIEDLRQVVPDFSLH